MQTGLFYILLVAVLATLPPSPVGALATTIKTINTTVCRTSIHSGSRTFTRYAPTQTQKVTRTLRPIATTVKTVTPKKTKTVTSVVASISTETVAATRMTDTVTATITDFVVVVPSTTVIAFTFTPTVTSYTSVLAGPTVTIQVTSYGTGAPLITLHEASKKRSEPTLNSHHRRANKAKDVFCTPSVKIIATVHKSATCTSTSTRTLKPSTVVVSSTVVATQTVTQFPKAATSTIIENASKTITAQTVTFSATETAAPSTTLSQIVEEAITVTNVFRASDMCKPEFQNDYGGTPVATDDFQQIETITEYVTDSKRQAFADSTRCCMGAYQRAASASFWQESTKTCLIVRPADSIYYLDDFCVIGNPSLMVTINTPPVSGWVGAPLACWTGFQRLG
ncbi:hypothetical protein A4X13_0g6832 [Tilletia indica]|uniref:Uncharacterized protein n=1 Tax=Tilletia indica TaxID=43049 RepID=A0A177TTI2_9BASI|nr:hypothetical protein A4X13_0g6832 [Tilletia indica]